MNYSLLKLLIACRSNIALTLFLFSLINFSNAISQEQEVDSKIRIQDSHGKWAFEQPPKKIAVINWTLTEQLFELGVTPVAVADLTGFRANSPQTTLPEKHNMIVDLGSRFSPNLELLKTTEPELIIIGYSQRDLMRPLSNIAPVMYFNNFSRRGDNLQRADNHFLSLATLFDKSSFAQQKLTERDAKIFSLRDKLLSTFKQYNKAIPTVTTVSIKGNDIWAYLNGSIPYGVLTKLGVSPELSEKPSKLGTHKLSNKQINEIQGCLLFINNSDMASSLPMKSKNKKESCYLQAEPANTFGGSISHLHLAESFTQALLKKFQ